MKIDLKGKNALIGGSSQGIGAAIALRFAEAGANLLLLARSEDNLKKVISTLPNDGSQVFDYAVVDFNNLNSLSQIVSEKLIKFITFNIIVNNTGGPLPAPAHNGTIEDFSKGLTMHLFAYQTILKIVLGGMKESRYGRIINITSVGAKQPVDNLGVSNTVRGAVSAWSKTLSRELAPFGITVNNILPGYINTDRLSSLFQNISLTKQVSVDEVIKNKLEEIPAGRLGEAEEIANASAFLASDLASYISGINLPVDGGLLRTL